MVPSAGRRALLLPAARVSPLDGVKSTMPMNKPYIFFQETSDPVDHTRFRSVRVHHSIGVGTGKAIITEMLRTVLLINDVKKKKKL